MGKSDFIGLEEAKKMIDPFIDDNSIIVKSTIWKGHWENARTSNKEGFLMNLLRNHVRLYDGRPASSGFSSMPDHSIERVQIIDFILKRLVNEFDFSLKTMIPDFLEQYLTDRVMDIAVGVRNEMVSEYGEDLQGRCVEASDRILEKILGSGFGIEVVSPGGWCQFDDEYYGSDHPWDPHTWVEVPALGLYVDVTADQFNYGMDAENEYPVVIVQKGLPHGMRYDEPSWDEYEFDDLSEDGHFINDNHFVNLLTQLEKFHNDKEQKVPLLEQIAEAEKEQEFQHSLEKDAKDYSFERY